MNKAEKANVARWYKKAKKIVTRSKTDNQVREAADLIVDIVDTCDQYHWSDDFEK